MKRQGMAMAALVTAMMLGVTTIPESVYVKAYSDAEETDVYYDDTEEADICYDDEYDDDNEYSHVYDEDDDIYDDDDIYEDDIYEDDIYEDEDLEDDEMEEVEFAFERSEYKIKIKAGAKSYADCGMDFAEELNFDSEQYDIEDIEWSVDDESIAIVDDEGYLTAVASGSVILTARLDGEETDCEVIIPEPSCQLSKYKAVIKKGRKLKLSVISNFGTMKNVTWKTSKKSVATVKKGVVTGKKKGSVKISAKVAGKTYTCTVKVKNK